MQIGKYSLISVIFFSTLILTNNVFAEEIKITTYYPSPYGVYEELRSTVMAIGSNYVDPSSYPMTAYPNVDLLIQGAISRGGSVFNSTAINLGHPSNSSADAEYSFVGPSASHVHIQNDASHSAIITGSSNYIRWRSEYSFIGTGSINEIGMDSEYSFIGTGLRNSIDNDSANSVIVGGGSNSINTDSTTTSSSYSVIGGGGTNTIKGVQAVIAGGWNNLVLARTGAIGGGVYNTINAEYGTIPGGHSNVILDGANFSFVAGQKATAANPSSFVWAGDGGAHSSSVANSFNIFSNLIHFESIQPQIHINASTGLQSIIRFQDSGVNLWGFLSNYPGTGQFALHNYGLSTNAIVLNANGNVGIGTNNPKSDFHVNGEVVLADSEGINFNQYYDSSTKALNGDSSFAIYLDDSNDRLIFEGQPGGVLADAVVDGRLNTIMALNPNGRVGIGTSSPSETLHVVGNVYVDGEIRATSSISELNRLELKGGGGSNSPGLVIGRQNNTMEGAEIYLRGPVSRSDWRVDNYIHSSGQKSLRFLCNDAGYFTWTYEFQPEGKAIKRGSSDRWSNYSDRRLKENIRPLALGLETLLQLKPKMFNYKKDKPGYVSGEHIGFVAQDVEKVIPNWVSDSDNGYKLLTISGFEAIAVTAFAELKEENELMQKQIYRLAQRIKELEQRK